MAVSTAAPEARPRRRPGVAAWALWALTILGLVVAAWLDHLLRQAGMPELGGLQAASAPLLAAAVSAATVGAVLAASLIAWLTGTLERFRSTVAGEVLTASGLADKPRTRWLTRPAQELGCTPAGTSGAVPRGSPTQAPHQRAGRPRASRCSR